MARIVLLVPFLSLVIIGTGCSDSKPVSKGECRVPSDCPGGEACVDGTCFKVCGSDLDCPGATICNNDICQKGSRENAPQILNLEADGSADSDPTHLPNHIHTRLTIVGSHLEGAGVTLSSDHDEWRLAVCETQPDRLVVELPEPIESGTYALTVASQAGSDCATLPVLQGEAGPRGPSGPTGPLPVVETNAGLVGTGSPGDPLGVDFVALDSRYPVRTDTCTDATAYGLTRWQGVALQVCTPGGWRTAYSTRPGLTQETSATSCKAIRDADPTAPDGWYWINPNGGPAGDAFEVVCDMTNDGGGWTELAKITTTTLNLVAATYINGLGSAGEDDFVTPCAKLEALDNRPLVRVAMGENVDFFRPVTASTLCAMLGAYNQHEWCPTVDGVYVMPTYYHAHLGGCATDWPPDGRGYIPFWGGGGAQSGCCHETLVDAGDWHRAFTIHIREH